LKREGAERQYWTQVTGQPHVSAVLTPGKGSSYTSKRRIYWLQSWSGPCGMQKTLTLLPGIGTWFLSLRTRRLVWVILVGNNQLFRTGSKNV